MGVLKGFPPQSIDCCVTDPPYGIGFMGKDWDRVLPSKQAFEQIFRVLKPGALAFVMSSPRQDVLWRMLKMLEDCGFQLRQSFISWIYKSGFPKAYDVSKGIDKKFKLKRKKIGVSKKLGAGFVRRGRTDEEVFSGVNVQRIPETITEPACEESKKWSGWKSVAGLKPALECVLMVNKPLSERTIVDNVLRHGVGAINVDKCRIPFQNENLVRPQIERRDNLAYGKGLGVGIQENPKGRFPANLLVSNGALDTGEITKSEGGKTILNHKHYGFKDFHMQGYGDVGDQSRYFDLDAWARHHGFLDVPKASKQERDMGLASADEKELYRMGHGNREEDNVTKRFRRKAKNVHPTVKPIMLGAYLVELGCPPDGVVLDPFCGTGSFLISAHKMNRKWIGIEIEPEYMEISKYRIATLNKKLSSFIRQ